MAPAKRAARRPLAALQVTRPARAAGAVNGIIVGGANASAIGRHSKIDILVARFSELPEPTISDANEGT